MESNFLIEIEEIGMEEVSFYLQRSEKRTLSRMEFRITFSCSSIKTLVFLSIIEVIIMYVSKLLQMVVLDLDLKGTTL